MSTRNQQLQEGHTAKAGHRWWSNAATWFYRAIILVFSPYLSPVLQPCKPNFFSISSAHRVAFSAAAVLTVFLAMNSVVHANVTPIASDKAPTDITVVPTDAGNLVIEKELNPHQISLRMVSPCHNWWMARLKNLATDSETTISLSMKGMDGGTNKGNVAKWQGLRPVMTYANPERYETYEWFTKDEQGRWVSGDPFKQGKETRFAGTGEVPEQSVIPKEVAEQFLSSDGKYWSAWREIDHVEAVTALNVFRCTQRFALPEVTIAMRVPYTYTYLQQFLDRLRTLKLPGVFVDEIGSTKNNKPIQIVRIESVTISPSKRETILITAREHATEPAGSWAAQGMMNRCVMDIMTKKNTQRTSWLFIPIQDPDGSIASVFDSTTEEFRFENRAYIYPEVFAYTNYLAQFVNRGRTIDLAVSLHNLEANEGSNLICPFIDANRIDTTSAINQKVSDEFVNTQFQTNISGKPWDYGQVYFRLFGWCAMLFNSNDLAYEVNDRYPANRLTLAQQLQLGDRIGAGLQSWLSSAEGKKVHQQCHQSVANHCKRREQYFKQVGRSPSRHLIGELLVYGY
ncbi:MAG TPA: M14 family zinc carboxypeptidase [Armatimonadota bacterium]|nr:M14 family zinc carboxypeptidase [Armatimonadota bacterium]